MKEKKKKKKSVPFDMCSNEDSNQPAHPRSLIRVFIARMIKLCTLGYINASDEHSDQTARKGGSF